MRWSEVEQRQRRLAELGRRMLGDPGVVLVATIRTDGAPRVSPVEPLFWNEDLWLSMGWGTLKAADLGRDSRVLVHSIVSTRDGSDGEYKLRGTAVPESGRDVQEQYAGAVAAQLGWTPTPGRFQLFRVDVADLTFIRWDDATNDQYVTRWPEGTEFVRRGTSATSLGTRESVHELLA
jgi:hypothetical protein